MYFLREQLFWSLWLLISVAAALYFHGCSLISLKTEPEKKDFQKLNLKTYFFIKVFTTSKNFCNIDAYKYKPGIIVNWLQSS